MWVATLFTDGVCHWIFMFTCFFFFSKRFILSPYALSQVEKRKFFEKKVEKRQFFGKKVEKRQFFRNNNCSPIKITVWLITSSNFLFCFIIKINKFNIYMLFLLCCCYFHLSWKNEEKKIWWITDDNRVCGGRESEEV